MHVFVLCLNYTIVTLRFKDNIILSSDEMLVVFYNCMYFEKGEKFKELLEKEEDGKRIDFFGDKEDLKNLHKGNDLPFFSKKDLIFSEKDMQKLEELIKEN